MSEENQTSNPQQPNLEELWQFSGQGLRSGDFNTAMVHFYRGELTRSNTWRARLDTTTNWAVITTGATITFAFSNPANTPMVLILNTLLVVLFLYMEARRYRYYELWTYRVRILEQNFFASLLSPPFMPRAEWADRLTSSLQNPRFPISLPEAFGRRYRRNYAPIFLILAVSWILKLFLHPTEARFVGEFLRRAEVGPFSGWVVIGVGVAFHVALILIGLFTAGMRASTGEVLSQGTFGKRFLHRMRAAVQEMLESELPQIPWFDVRKQMALIVSDSPQAVGQALLDDLQQGVTMLHGTGMYTGQPHGVLMCTFQAKQQPALKQTVQRVDPKAFVVVMSVQGAHGGGFRPLEA